MDRPEQGKVYSLMGIMQGKTWADSVVEPCKVCGSTDRIDKDGKCNRPSCIDERDSQ